MLKHLFKGAQKYIVPGPPLLNHMLESCNAGNMHVYDLFDSTEWAGLITNCSLPPRDKDKACLIYVFFSFFVIKAAFRPWNGRVLDEAQLCFSGPVSNSE